MDLSDLTSEQVIKEYLKDFPVNEWKTVLKKTLVYGIQSLKALETVGLSSLKAEKVPALKLQISELKTSNKKNTSDSSFQKNQPTRSNSNSNFEKKNKEPRSHRHRSQNKINFKENKKIKLLNGKYPTKLVGREINTTR